MIKIIFDSKVLRNVATFAMGLFPLASPAPTQSVAPTATAQEDIDTNWSRRFDEAQTRYRASIRKPVKVESIEGVEPSPALVEAPTAKVIPTDEDRAFQLGWELGRDDVPAIPTANYSEGERVAFLAGLDRGQEEYVLEQLAATEAWILSIDEAHEADLYSDTEYAEAYMTTPSGFAMV